MNVAIFSLYKLMATLEALTFLSLLRTESNLSILSVFYCTVVHNAGLAVTIWNLGWDELV